MIITDLLVQYKKIYKRVHGNRDKQSPPLHTLFILWEIPDYNRKGRDKMNIFKNKEDFFGSIENDVTDGTLLSLFQLAKQIKNRLGKQGYLLDCYLSIFFDGVSNILTYEVADECFLSNNNLQSFFLDLFESEDENKKESNFIYKKAKELFYNQISKLPYQEKYTKVNLLLILIADDMLSCSTTHFVKEKAESLNGIVDEIRMKELYEQISHVVGESMMEELNLKLKQRFLIAPAAMVFAQGMNNDLLYRLSSRDDETSKEMFQLLLDNLIETA